MIKSKILSSRFLVFSVIVILLNLIFGGCYSLKEVGVDNDRTEKIYKIETTDEKIIDFRKTDLGYAFISGDNVVSINEKGEEKYYPIAEIKKYYTEKFDIAATLWMGTGIIILALIWLGFLYSSLYST